MTFQYLFDIYLVVDGHVTDAKHTVPIAVEHGAVGGSPAVLNFFNAAHIHLWVVAEQGIAVSVASDRRHQPDPFSEAAHAVGHVSAHAPEARPYASSVSLTVELNFLIRNTHDDVYNRTTDDHLKDNKQSRCTNWL